jgi:hypothetical protein
MFRHARSTLSPCLFLPRNGHVLMGQTADVVDSEASAVREGVNKPGDSHLTRSKIRDAAVEHFDSLLTWPDTREIIPAPTRTFSICWL